MSSCLVTVCLGVVRVAVSATPGKTKHFQTLVVSDSLLLCDCPGECHHRTAMNFHLRSIKKKKKIKKSRSIGYVGAIDYLE